MFERNGCRCRDIVRLMNGMVLVDAQYTRIDVARDTRRARAHAHWHSRGLPGDVALANKAAPPTALPTTLTCHTRYHLLRSTPPACHAPRRYRACCWLFVTRAPDSGVHSQFSRLAVMNTPRVRLAGVHAPALDARRCAPYLSVYLLAAWRRLIPATTTPNVYQFYSLVN